MSETNKNHLRCRLSPLLLMVALLAMLISWRPLPTGGQDLSAYGADMCAELGIPADRCSLSTSPSPSGTSSAAGDKTATLVEHGRRVCEQEGVPMEDCKAVPFPHRKDETIMPVASFLTVPERIPAPDPGLVPVPVITDAPAPSRQPGIRYAHPPVQPAGPPLRYVGPPPVDPGFRYAGPPIQPVGPDFRYAAPLPPPAEPALRFVEPPLAGRGERADRLEGFREPERFRQRERHRVDAPSGRCLRAIRYSRPPSYRYVTC